MEGKQRYIIFGVGVLLGCLILSISYKGKYDAIKKRKEIDILNGYNPVQRIVVGEDFSAKNPFDTGPAISTRDYPPSLEGTFTRVIIAKGTNENSLWRIEETLWKDPNSMREKLIKRQIMHADRLVVRLKEDSNDKELLSKELEPFNMEVLECGRRPRLYVVRLPSHSLDAIPEAIDLLSKVTIVEAAVPDYIRNF